MVLMAIHAAADAQNISLHSQNQRLTFVYKRSLHFNVSTYACTMLQTHNAKLKFLH